MGRKHIELGLPSIDLPVRLIVLMWRVVDAFDHCCETIRYVALVMCVKRSVLIVRQGGPRKFAINYSFSVDEQRPTKD
jgi:hypothetical protein